jgi:hypothetical protein
VLGVVGLYGVIAYTVSQRAREISVRMALGAQRRSVYWLVMGDAGRLVSLGAALGVVVAVALGTLMQHLLFAVEAEEELLAGETRTVILQAIDALPPAQREVIVLRDIEGLPSTAICNIRSYRHSSTGSAASGTVAGSPCTRAVLCRDGAYVIDKDVPEMPCRELVELITDYLEDRLSPVDRLRFEAHLATCEACHTYLEQFRQTIRLLGRLPEESLSPEAENALVAAFRGWSRR